MAASAKHAAVLNKPASDQAAPKSPGQSRAKGFLLFVTGVTAIAGFLYGYDTGIISSALLQIREDFHLSQVGHSQTDQAHEELKKVRPDEGSIDAEIREIQNITDKEEN